MACSTAVYPTPMSGSWCSALRPSNSSSAGSRASISRTGAQDLVYSSGIAAYYPQPMNVVDDTAAAEGVGGTYISVNAFRLLEIVPLLGRDFGPDDEHNFYGVRDGRRRE
jgi:hypothetical protein